MSGDGPLVFLSYARVTPLSSGADLDPSVRTFYTDLCRRVGERLKNRAVRTIGYLDTDVPAETDWRANRLAALAAAEVFVPLYSPPYFRNSWSVEERNSYLAKSSGAVIPVLWTPFGPGERVAEASVAVAAGGGSARYESNGLRALCRLTVYRREYLDVVDSIADRIVAVLDGAAAGIPRPRPAPLAADGAKPVTYTVGVIALTRDDQPARARIDCYGHNQQLWRPFGPAHALPIAAYAEIVAQRLGLPTAIVEMTGHGEHIRGPGVVLIDPWVMEVDARRRILGEAMLNLPQWVRCLVIISPADGPHSVRGGQLAKRVSDMLGRFGLTARLAHALIEFDQLMPRLVGESRRAYLRHGREPMPELQVDGESRAPRGRLTPGDQLPRPRRNLDD